MKIMCDFDGTFMVPKEGVGKTQSMLSFAPIRSLVGLLSWSKAFSEFVTRDFIPNHDLIRRFNQEREWASSLHIDFVCARGFMNFEPVFEEIVASELDLSKISIGMALRTNFLERHSDFKKRLAIELQPDVIIEDCLYYRQELSTVVSKKTLILTPDWRVMAK